ncbi:MAG: HK97 gp10 family phage protein [Erysipelotrichaceae bacterium]
MSAVFENMDSKKEQILETWGEFLVAEASARTPVNKGDLRQSIHHEIRLNNNAVDIIAGGEGISEEVDYAPHIEFGTSKMQAQPFMQPAIQENTRKLEQIAENILGSR